MKVNYIVIVLLLIMNIGTIFFFIKSSNRERASSIKYESNIGMDENDSELPIKVLKSEGLKLSPEFLLVNNESDTLFLTDLVADTKLIVNLSTVDCNKCLSSEIKILETIYKNFNQDNVLVFVNYRTHQDINVFSRLNRLKINTYNKSFKSFGIPLEEGNENFIFIIDKDLTASNFFVANETKMELLDHYLESIKRKYSL